MKPTHNVLADDEALGDVHAIDSALTRQIIGCAMKVHGTLGAGFLESVYQKAFLHELTKVGLLAESDQLLQVRYDGVVVGDFRTDLIVNREIIIEIKAIASLTVEHELQLVNYLTATGKDSGLLINFGRYSLEFKRKFRNTKNQTRPVARID